MRRWFALWLGCSSLVACSRGSDLAPPSPVVDGGVSDAGDAGPDAPPVTDGGTDAGSPLGKPCVQDDECGDDVACTFDQCDPVEGRCRNTPDDTRCADDRVCNGVERCDAAFGCRPGPPVTCSDNDACTIDTCVEGSAGGESTGVSCQHVPRDADGDGDPDNHCGGQDCDDTNPAISSLRSEICANAIDDNCDGTVDGEVCVQPANDTCNDPRILPGPGAYILKLTGSKLDTSATCAPVSVVTLRDVVAGLTVPEGPPRRVDVRVTWPYGINAVSLGQQCGVAESELACSPSLPNTTNGGQIARLRVHSAPPAVYPLIVYGSQDFDATVSYELSDADEAPTHETCGTALPLAPDTPTLVPLVGAKGDVPMSCGSPQYPDLVYRVELDQAYDVRAFASPHDGIGNAIVSLRKPGCSQPGDEIACATGQPATAFSRRLGPGPLYVSVSAFSGSDVDLLVHLSPPTDPPADESCTTGSPALTPGVDRLIDLTDHTDDFPYCSAALPDAAYALAVPAPSDLLLVLRPSQGSYGALSLARPPCQTSADLVECKAALPSPIRVQAHNVPTGAYRVVSELSQPTPAKLTAFRRKATAPVLVPFADGCDDAVLIPPEGGFFRGNTANVNAQFTASCDQGGSPNAPDQLLRLELTEKKRVVLDMNGSAFPTLLDVRRGPSCPGTEVDLACTIGVAPQRSFLDLTLEPGTYFLQIDGFNGASGAWSLDVFVADP